MEAPQYVRFRHPGVSGCETLRITIGLMGLCEHLGQDNKLKNPVKTLHIALIVSSLNLTFVSSSPPAHQQPHNCRCDHFVQAGYRTTKKTVNWFFFPKAGWKKSFSGWVSCVSLTTVLKSRAQNSFYKPLFTMEFRGHRSLAYTNCHTL